jgi:putative spermidine/putrescine transport system permease protein
VYKKLLLAILFALFTLPFGYLLVLSLASEWRFPDLLPASWTANHWTTIGSTGGNWIESALTSLLLAIAVACMATTAGFFTAQHLAGHSWRRLWLILAYLPYTFSPVIYAHCIRFYFNVAGLSGTFSGVLLAQFMLTYPFAILLFFNHFDPSIRAMEALTYTLGGSRRAAFWRVLVPVSRTVLLICFFQVFLISWFEYGLTSVIGQGQVRTLTIAIYQYIGEANQYVAALASCLVCLPPLLLLWLNQRFVFQPTAI